MADTRRVVLKLYISNVSIQYYWQNVKNPCWLISVTKWCLSESHYELGDRYDLLYKATAH
jgi:hypothetical protein